MADAPSAAPVAKVAAAGTAGAAVTVLVWVLSAAGVEVPSEVAASLVTLASFAAGYATPTRE